MRVQLIRAAALLTLLLGLGVDAGADEPDKPASPKPGQKKAEAPLDEDFQKQVDAAIKKGSDWLVEQQRKDGSFHAAANKLPPGVQLPPGAMAMPMQHEFGETALAALALVHSGHDAKSKPVKKALAYLKRKWKSVMTGSYLAQASSYSLSIYVMLLHAVYAKPPKKDKSSHDGRYARGGASKSNPCGYSAYAKKTIRTILNWLQEKQAEKGLWRYPGGLPTPQGGGFGPPGMGGPAPGGGAPETFAGPEDLSCAQYVLLALWVGSRCGIKVDPKVVEAAAKRLLAWQQEKGPSVPRGLDGEDRYSPPKDRARGFGYTFGMPPTGSMTAAGLSSLLIVRLLLDRKHALQKDIEQASWDAIAWLSQNFSVTANPPMQPMWHYYYLYGLERAFVIARKKLVGDRDWYREGAEVLIGQQDESGRWAPASGGFGPSTSKPTWDTCFALLFLKRALPDIKRPPLQRVTTPR